jgi:hypothetical protein
VPRMGAIAPFLLWALVLVQLLLPLSYYAGLRDPDDERFAWRMFSAVRLRRCTSRLVRDGHPAVDARPIANLHSSWVAAIDRGRTRVIARYLQQFCGRDAVHLERQCSSPSGAQLPKVAYRFDCAQASLVTQHAQVGGP